jgi:hypothetical protein
MYIEGKCPFASSICLFLVRVNLRVHVSFTLNFVRKNPKTSYFLKRREYFVDFDQIFIRI